MEMFLLPCFTDFLLYRNSRMPYYVSIKPYNSTVQEFCAVQLRLYGCVGPSHFHSPYERWRAGILRKKNSRFWEQSRSTPRKKIEHHANRSYTNRFAAHLCCSLIPTFLREPMLRARLRAQNKNGVQQRRSLWAWLIVVLYITIFW